MLSIKFLRDSILLFFQVLLAFLICFVLLDIFDFINMHPFLFRREFWDEVAALFARYSYMYRHRNNFSY